MRVWAFPSFYPYDYPGLQYSGIFAHRQYKGLIENGADLKVIFPVPWNPVFPLSLLHTEWKHFQQLAYPNERVYDGITVCQPRIANIKPSRIINKPYHQRYVECVVDFFKKKSIKLHRSTDIFYSQWLPSSAFVQLAAHQLGVRSAILSIGDDVVLWPHGSSDNFKWFTRTMREADLRYSCAAYLGHLANKTLGEDLPFDVVMMGVDYDFFKPVAAVEKAALRKEHNIAASDVVVLQVGTAVVRKGWLDLFDAMEQVKKTTNHFKIVGVHTSTPDFDFAIELSKRGLTDHFIDLGTVPPRSLNKVYNMADIFCLPSHAEGMANVVMEAMSSGLATVTTNVGGHSELITNGENGVLVPMQQPDILAEKLLALITDTAYRNKLGADARNFIVNRWGNFADNTKKMYEQFCQV